MSSVAAGQGAMFIREMHLLGVSEFDRSTNYHIKCTYKGHDIDFCCANNYFKLDGVQSRGRDLLIKKLKEL